MKLVYLLALHESVPSLIHKFFFVKKEKENHLLIDTFCVINMTGLLELVMG